MRFFYTLYHPNRNFIQVVTVTLTCTLFTIGLYTFSKLIFWFLPWTKHKKIVIIWHGTSQNLSKDPTMKGSRMEIKINLIKTEIIALPNWIQRRRKGKDIEIQEKDKENQQQWQQKWVRDQEQEQETYPNKKVLCICNFDVNWVHVLVVLIIYWLNLFVFFISIYASQNKNKTLGYVW